MGRAGGLADLLVLVDVRLRLGGHAAQWDRDREFLPWVTIVSLVTLAFFLSLSIFIENPFVRLWQTSAGQITSAMFPPARAVPYLPPDGNGDRKSVV